MSRQRPEPKVGFRTITPAEAQKLLDGSKRKNRPPTPVKVRTYAARMKAGTWNPHNSTAISRDWNGDLVNGHNRLRASIAADAPFTTLFVDGVDPASYADEDTGAVRQPADFVGSKYDITNRQKAACVASAAKTVELWDRGLWRYAGGSVMTHNMPEMVISNDQLFAAIDRRPDILKAADFVMARRRLIGRKMRIGLLAALWVLTRGHRAHANFWAELVDGVEISPTSPVRLLRNRLDSHLSQGHNMKGPVFLALLTKVWNAYATDGRIDKLMWSRGKGEAFPEPVTRLKPARPAPEAAPEPDAKAAA